LEGHINLNLWFFLYDRFGPYNRPSLSIALSSFAIIAVQANSMMSFFDLEAVSVDGTTLKFASFKGSVVLATNVASQ